MVFDESRIPRSPIDVSDYHMNEWYISGKAVGVTMTALAIFVFPPIAIGGVSASLGSATILGAGTAAAVPGAVGWGLLGELIGPATIGGLNASMAGVMSVAAGIMGVNAMLPATFIEFSEPCPDTADF